MPKYHKDQWLISFVIPVYNVELYLEETVDSLVAQTVGFEKNCEIIFVNDGSIDESEAICLRYKEMYPNNVTYIKQENLGPGEARNKGFDVARGKYINPIDSDDKLSPDAAKEACDFLEKNYSEVDIVGIKWELFDAKKGGHPLNYKFTHDRVIDLNEEFTHIQSSVATAFFKRESLIKHRFEPRVGKYAEDGRFMGEIMLEKGKIGVVVKPTYYYRKRSDHTSSQDNNVTDKFWYLETPKRAWYDLVEYTKRKTGGEIPKYIQFLIMYDLQWRFSMSKQSTLDNKETEQYKELLYGLLKYIDDEVLLSQKNLDIDRKLFLLSKKHNTDVLSLSTLKSNKYYFKGQPIYNMNEDKPTIHVEILDADRDSIRIEGYYTGYLPAGGEIRFCKDGKFYKTNRIEKCTLKKYFVGEVILERHRFKVKIPASQGSICVEADGCDGLMQLYFHRYSYLSNPTSFSYRASGGWLISRGSNTLDLLEYSWTKHFIFELRYMLLVTKRLRIQPFLKNLKLWKKFKSGESGLMPPNKWMLIPLKSARTNASVIAIRLAYYLLLPFKRQQIWLLSDRIMAADDSGEIVFRYIQQLEQRDNIKAYFTISKDSEEYASLKKAGPVVDFGGLRHKILFLMADKVISSEATDAIINVFGWKLNYFVDLYAFDFVFLQHGIIRDDISGWLNKYNKNIKMFVTSVKPEYKSIIEGDYCYDESVVKLTGLPRYDWLSNEPQNQIALMPTWRDELAGKVDVKTGVREYNPDFTKSEYYHFFEGLMNDERLLEVMRRHDVKGKFYIHPSFQTQTDDFKGNDVFTVMHMPHNYPLAKSEAKLMITDYSSVAFDFAYLRKPVIYSQFDADNFYQVHTSKMGYFTYEDDGFGAVTTDPKSTIDETIAVIKADFDMANKYEKRAEKFFAFDDKNNAKRVYEEILQQDKDAKRV